MLDEVFYDRCAAILRTEHIYKEPLLRRSRWNNRQPGNGRFEGFGIIRKYGSQVHMAIRSPEQASRLFNSPESALAFLINLVSRDRMIVVGLTGGIACGKSTVSAMIAGQAIPVWDADRAVHTAYADDADLYAAIAEAFPAACSAGSIDRQILGQIALSSPENELKLKGLVKGAINDSLAHFYDEMATTKHQIAVLDVPLLFESGMDRECDVIIDVVCPPSIQRERALARSHMTQKKFDRFLSLQITDEERRKRSTYIVDTDVSMDALRQRVSDVIADIRDGIS